MEINFSIKPNVTRRVSPEKIITKITKKSDIIPNELNVIPASTRNNPPANEIFPSQSIFSFLINPNSLRFL